MSLRAVTLVEIAIKAETADGPLADALRELAQAVGGPTPTPTGNGVVFRPGLPTSAPYYATWPEVQAIVALEQGDVVVYVDNSNAPAVVTGSAAQNNGFGRLVISPAMYAFVGPLIQLEIADGASIDNMRAFIGPLKVVSGRTNASPPPLAHSGVNVVLLAMGAQLELLGTATKPFVEIASGETFALGMEQGAGVSNAAVGPAVPFAEMLTGMAGPAVHAWFTFAGFQWQGAGIVKGGANAIFQYVHDLSSGGVDVSAIVGGQVSRQLLDSSSDITFKPGAPATSLGATEFAVWSDVLANLPSAGASSHRGPLTLHFDSSFAPGNVCVVPAPAVPGVLLFEGPATWKGTDSTFGTDVRLSDGVQLGDSLVFQDLNLEILNTVTPVIASVSDVEVRFDSVKIDVVGTQPFFGVSTRAGVGRLILRGRSAFNSGVCASVSGAGARLDIDAYDRSRIAANTLDYPANTVGDIRLDGAARLDYTQLAPGFAPDLPGSVPTLAVDGTFRESFVDPGLTRTQTVVHNLSEKYVSVEIYSNLDDVEIIGVGGLNIARITAITENSLDIVFTAPIIVGTWHVVVRR